MEGNGIELNLRYPDIFRPAAISGPVLAVGVLAQFLINRGKGKNLIRYGLWAASLVIWFGLSFFSIIHAVS